MGKVKMVKRMPFTDKNTQIVDVGREKFLRHLGSSKIEMKGNKNEINKK